MSPHSGSLCDMPHWPEPQVSRSQVDAAGAVLVSSAPDSPDRAAAEVIVNNWRSSHSYPLHSIKMTLKSRARTVQTSALVAHRLKRLSSIALKLSIHKHMKLSQMQDIGGCRAVLSNVRQVELLVKLYNQTVTKNPHTIERPQLISVDDYITNPKKDGYRGYHLIYKYHTKSPSRCAYDNLRIEIQLRSELQHAWATAVETISTFTGQALKSNIGEDKWKRFFALMSCAIARREGRPLVPGTPDDHADLSAELRKSASALKVQTQLQAWGMALQTTEEETGTKEAYLLELDPEKMTLNIRGYVAMTRASADQDYLAAERRVENIAGGQAVLVSADSLAALRKAYPNYFLDTTAFIAAVNEAIKPVRRRKRK